MPYLDEKEIREYNSFVCEMDGRFPMLFDSIKNKEAMNREGVLQMLSFQNMIKTIAHMNPARVRQLSLSDVEMLNKLAEKMHWHILVGHDYELNYDYVNGMHSFTGILEVLKPYDESQFFVKKPDEILQKEQEKKRKSNEYLQTLSVEDSITDEQNKRYSLCADVYKALTEIIEVKRNDAIDILLDKRKSSDEKKLVLEKYIEERMSMTGVSISLQDGDVYSEEDLLSIARRIYDDKTFLYNDNSLVLNSLSFRADNITFVDEIIAFHNYSISHDETALFYLIKMITVFVSETLKIERGTFDAELPDIPCSEVDSVDYVKRVITDVSNYWNKYSRFFSADITKELNDDWHEEFAERIDEEAAREIGKDDQLEKYENYLILWNELLSSAASEDEINECRERIAEIESQIEREKMEYDSCYVSDRLSRCTKTVYLLLSTVKEINSPKLKTERRVLRDINSDICEILYSKETDPYGEMEDDIRLNREPLRNAETVEDSRRVMASKDRVIQLLEDTIRAQVMELEGADAGTILNKRNEILSQLKADGISGDVIELIEEYSIKISKALEKSIVPSSLEPYRKKIKKELGCKYKLLSVNAVDTLASAEYLYSVFVKGNHPAQFDFSGIAVLYFQAFEATYNKLLVSRYTKWLQKNGYADIFENYALKSYNKTLQNSDTEDMKKYYQPSQINNIVQYDSRIQEYVLSDTMEIGKLFFLFKWYSKNYDSAENGECSKFKEFLVDSDGFGKIVDKKRIDDFAGKLYYTKDHRNTASHGTIPVGLEEVKTDKRLVYDDSNIQDIQRYKNILYEFLDLIDENRITNLT